MAKIKASYWKVNESRYKLQLRTNRDQEEVENILPGWECVSFGYVPHTQEDILVFEKDFKSEMDWTKFLKSDTIIETIEMKEA